uniref:Uncharacterized protein n=1 Tax=Opuntia streptacantha TaxID=393608 RepID=A0A7C9EG56_OPUST
MAAEDGVKTPYTGTCVATGSSLTSIPSYRRQEAHFTNLLNCSNLMKRAIQSRMLHISLKHVIMLALTTTTIMLVRTLKGFVFDWCTDFKGKKTQRNWKDT